MCKCCGTKTEYEEKRQTGCVDVYVFFCPRGACESYGQEQIIAIDLDELYGY